MFRWKTERYLCVCNVSVCVYVSVEERKVFVGMLSKSLVESDVTMMFAPFGNVEDCSVVKDHEGNSKGITTFFVFILITTIHLVQED